MQAPVAPPEEIACPLSLAEHPRAWQTGSYSMPAEEVQLDRWDDLGTDAGPMSNNDTSYLDRPLADAFLVDSGPAVQDSNHIARPGNFDFFFCNLLSEPSAVLH